MENICYKNKQLISELKNVVSDKMNNENEMVNINNLYGIFIEADDNEQKFIVCKEEKYSYSEGPHLSEFFTNEYIDRYEVRINEIVCPWHNAGRHYFLHFLKMGFCLPIVNLLGKHCIDGKVSKKELSDFYRIVNEYIKENPNFIDELIENEKNKMI